MKSALQRTSRGGSPLLPQQGVISEGVWGSISTKILFDRCASLRDRTKVDCLLDQVVTGIKRRDYDKP